MADRTSNKKVTYCILFFGIKPIFPSKRLKVYFVFENSLSTKQVICRISNIVNEKKFLIAFLIKWLII